MDETKINELLKIRGARRAADGVLIDFDDGATFHLTESIALPVGLEPHELFFAYFCSLKEILRLRELRTGHDYLLRLRANAIANSPRAQRVFSKRQREYKNTGRPWSLTHYYHLMDRYHKEYIQLMPRSERKIVKSLPSGMALIAEANAICVRSFLGPVVMVSEGLEHFYYFMTIACYGNQLGVPFIDRMCALAIAVRIMNGAEALDFDLDPRGALPTATERATRSLVAAQMQFTYGHEYAHFLRNHLPSPFIEGTSTPPPGATYDPEAIATFEHEMEYEADLFAVRHIAHHGDVKERVARGAISVLVFLAFIEECATLHSVDKLRVYKTHPKSSERLKRLWQSLGKSSGVSEKEMNGCVATGEQLQDIFGRFIEGQQPDLLTLYGSAYLPSFAGRPKRDRFDY
jgi:hypothetical protein